MHSGPTCATPELTDTLYEWVTEKRGSELNVSTTDIIDKAASLDLQCKGGNILILFGLVYRFMRRRSLGIRVRTRVA